MRKISRRGFLVSGVAAGIVAGSRDTRSQPAFNRDALVAAARKEGKIVWYATMPEEQLGLLLKRFSERYPFIDNSGSFRAPSGRMKARLDAEIGAGRVLGDVLQMGSFGQFLEFVKAGQIERFYTPEMEAYPASFKDGDLWTIFRSSPMMIVYNPRRLPDAEAPKSWSDLFDPKYRGKIAFLDSNAGGQHIHWYVMREKYGNDYWQKLIPNKAVMLAAPNQVMDGLLTGEFLVSGAGYTYAIMEYQRNNAPVKFVIPSEGVPIMATPIGIIKGGPNPNAARLFVDWILSREGQMAVVDILNDYSPRTDVPAPKGMPDWQSLNKLYPGSWDKLVATTAEFKKEWDGILTAKP